MCAEPSHTLIVEVGLNRIDATNENIKTNVEFLFVDQVWVIDVSLQLIFVVNRIFGQVAYFTHDHDAVTTSTFGRLSNENLSRILLHVAFKVARFIRQQKWIRHEFELDREKPLQPADDHAKYVLLGKMVHQGISIENALVIGPNDVQVLISQSHAIPQDRALTIPRAFPEATLTDYVLHCIQLTFAMMRIYNDLLSPQFQLLHFLALLIRTIWL